MKFIYVLLIALIPFSANAEVNDAEKQKLQAAVEYEKVMPVKGSIESMMVELAKLPDFQKNPEMLKKISAIIDVEELRKMTIMLVAKHFTLEEIISMRDYYSTDIGQSVYKKMPVYMADVMPVMQKYVQQAMIIGMQEAAKEQQQNQGK
jgi:hypothetical protein